MRAEDSPGQGYQPPDLDFSMNVSYLCLWASKTWGDVDDGNYNNVSYRTKEFMKR